MSNRTALLLSLGLVSLVGCNTVIVDDGSGGAGGSGGQGGSGGAGGVCEEFLDQAPSKTLTFRFRNESGMDVYVPASCSTLVYDLQQSPVPSDDLWFGPFGGSCQQTCEDLQSEGPVLCEADACAPTSYRIPSGGLLEVPWDAVAVQAVEMPASCWAMPEYGTSCQRIVTAPEGQYTLTIDGRSECGAGCTCDASGLCTGYPEGLQAYPTPAQFELATADVVEVLFDVCAFGCPDSGG